MDSARKGMFGRPSVAPVNQSVAGKRNPKFHEETENHLLETFGGQLPLTIRDSLVSAAAFSARIEESGLCFVVSGRNLRLWSLKPGDRSVKTFALPASELPLSRCHVCLTTFRKTTSLACVTPGGILRFWKSTGNPKSYNENTIAARGQEMHSVVQVNSQKFVLATTTSSVYFVESNFTTRELKASNKSRLTSRISSVASYLWGSDTSESYQLRRLLVPVRSETSILFMTSLELVQIDFIQEKVNWNVNLTSLLKPELIARFGDGYSDVQDISFIDACYWPDECDIVILCSVKNSAEYRYFLFHLHEKSMGIDFVVTGYDTGFHLNQNSVSIEDITSFQLVLPSDRICEAFLMNDRQVIRVPLLSEGPESPAVDFVDFSISSDKLLGFGVYENLLLMLSPLKGLVKYQNKGEKLPRECQSSVSLQETLKAISESISEPSRQLRQIFAIIGDTSMTPQILETLSEFLNQFDRGQCDSVLDNMIWGCAASIVDESLGDLENPPEFNFDIVSMFGERRVLMIKFMDFVEKVGLSSVLTEVILEDRKVPTILGILELLEKLDCLAIVHAYHTANPSLFEGTVQLLVQKRGAVHSSNDWMLRFYKNTSKMEELLSALTEHQMNGHIDFSVSSATVLTNLHADIQRRCCEIRGSFKGSNVKIPQDFVPWSLSPWFYGVISNHLTWATRNVAADSGLEVYQSVHNFAVSYLDCLSQHFEFIKETDPSESFLAQLQQNKESVRRDFVQQFLRLDQLSYALSLAEKFQDFETLVEICSQNDELRSRLETYQTMYKDLDFDNYLFRHYYTTGQLGKLINTKSENLTEFLRGYPTLSWIGDVKAKNFESAVLCLLSLANKEQHNLHLKKTLLSFAKLYALRGGMQDDAQIWNSIDISQEQVLFQENLPDSIKKQYALQDPRNSPVLSIEQLIKFFVANETGRSLDSDFMSSLALLEMLGSRDEETKTDLKLLIWTQAAKKTVWSFIDSNEPDFMRNVSESLFYRVLSEAPPETVVNVNELCEYLTDEGVIDEREDLLVRACYEAASC